jgi:hypothetical protein
MAEAAKTPATPKRENKNKGKKRPLFAVFTMTDEPGADAINVVTVSRSSDTLFDYMGKAGHFIKRLPDIE